LKFPPEIADEGSASFEIYSYMDRLIHFNVKNHEDKTFYRFFDTNGKNVVLEHAKGAILTISNFLTVFFQKEDDTDSKKKEEFLQSGFVETIDAFTMKSHRVYYQVRNEQADPKGENSTRFYDWSLKKIVEIGHNFNGPVSSVEKLGEKVTFTDISLQCGKKMIYEGGILYANIYADQIHQYDCLNHQNKVYQLEPKQRVISAMRFANTDNGIHYRSAFLVYDLESEELVFLVS